MRTADGPGLLTAKAAALSSLTDILHQSPALHHCRIAVAAGSRDNGYSADIYAPLPPTRPFIAPPSPSQLREMPAETALPEATTVCVVGAGPSGMACALGLAARSIPVVLVDALEAGHNSSRAIGIQASALEALNATHPQLVTDLLSDGIPSKTFTTIDLAERELLRLRLYDLAQYTQFPFMLLLTQHKAERRMRAALSAAGVPIHWNTRVTSYTPSDAGHVVSFASGQTLTARYVVGADGHHSTIRFLAGIALLNPLTRQPSAPSPADPSFVVADVLLAEPIPPNLPRDRIQIMVGGGGMVLSAPLLSDSPNPRKKNFFRLYLGVGETPPSSPDLAYVQAILDTRGPGAVVKTEHGVVKVEELLHAARYRTRPALVEKMVQRAEGREAWTVLIGDAAHGNAPAGGQGMALGICDGAELAAAIHEHLTAPAGPGPDAMDVYAARRHAVAYQVVTLVEDIMQVEKGGMDWKSRARNNVIWAAGRVAPVNRLLAWKISGLGNKDIKGKV
ncbi:FAD/NAD(P)-binding domain-containing protein [Mycena indigotica]|uniref:FAD/NAD(P)-binding domain-containing protein n=1 Tax=Mycena indigotica TaxID=2126181 RepID=A0A8H6T1G8_9AGAR|nr:FAD/NAD(P)-binding domain-containing protein [Mycena indigotica]KAF7310280.1 FAD/NAD(P)-binding domain-containing protein [Mycena indigotica]